MISWSAVKRCLPSGVRSKQVDSIVVMFVPVIQWAFANRWIRRSILSDISLSVIASHCCGLAAGPGAGAGGQGDPELVELCQVEPGFVGSAELVAGDGAPVGLRRQALDSI